jgi:hypothetical protein
MARDPIGAASPRRESLRERTMYAFDYARPESLKDAASALRRNGEARPLR